MLRARLTAHDADYADSVYLRFVVLRVVRGFRGFGFRKQTGITNHAKTSKEKIRVLRVIRG